MVHIGFSGDMVKDEAEYFGGKMLIGERKGRSRVRKGKDGVEE